MSDLIYIVRHFSLDNETVEEEFNSKEDAITRIRELEETIIETDDVDLIAVSKTTGKLVGFN